MRGVGGEVNRRQSARLQDLGVILERFLFALEPAANTEQQTACQIEQGDLAAGADSRDEILVSVVAEEHKARQQHHNSDAHQPVRAEAHFKGRTFLRLGFGSMCLRRVGGID